LNAVLKKTQKPLISGRVCITSVFILICRALD